MARNAEGTAASLREESGECAASGDGRILAGFALPHPPLIVPGVGRGQEQAIQPTIDAYREVARRISALSPDVLILSSPHAPLYRDGFYVAAAEHVAGTMAQFRAPQEAVQAAGDPSLARAVADAAARAGLAVGFDPSATYELDHASFIPLYFLKEALPRMRVVVVGLSGLTAADHRRFGCAVAEAVQSSGCRAVYLASGDLSHKLKADGPYGFAPEGPQLDAAIAHAFEGHGLEALFGFDEAFCEAAAECGLRSFQMMVGAVEQQNRADGLPADAGTSELLSYEGPFGVGYAVAEMRPGCPGVSAEGEREAAREGAAPTAQDQPDPYVALAREAVEAYVAEGRIATIPTDAPPELTDRRAGVFVSLHEGGQLRGCIGTIAPTAPSIAEEIIRNGMAAATRDPRFRPVAADELDYLDYSVDVLADPEPIDGPDRLDPRRYGVIVTQGQRRGLLLPNLEGVETVADQLAIAKQKAGIDPDDDRVQLERFEVVRHRRGGQPRKSAR